MSKGRIWRKFPLFLSLLFCVYAFGLIQRNLDAQHRLKNTEISRIVDLNNQLAATFGDYLAEQGRFVSDLAQGPEISNYRANKALGMSPRYGLRASLDAVTVTLRKVRDDRHVGGRHLFQRLAYVDETGEWLADSTDQGPRAALPPPGMTVLASARAALLVVPVPAQGGGAGLLAAWLDLDALAAFLLPHAVDRLDRTFLLYADDEAGELSKPLRGMRPGDVVSARDEGAGARFVLTGQVVPGTSLKVVSVRDEAALEGGEESDPFLVIAGFLPILMVLAAVGFDGFQSRHEAMRLEVETSRQRLQGVSDNLAEGIVLVDHDGNVLLANRAAVAMVRGDAPLPERMPLGALIRLEDGAALPWRQVLRDGRNLTLDDVRLHGVGGGFDVAMTLSPMDDPAAGAAVLVAFRDIRAIKQAQQQLMQSARLVSIGQLAAGVAHEINTPAQYVGSNLAFLEDEIDRLLLALRAARGEAVAAPELSAEDFAYLVDEVPLAIRQSRDGIAQISQIVRSMKEFSHPGATHQSAADLNNALRNTLTVSRNAWKHVAEVDLDLQDDLPPVLCQEAEMNQVFLNLIVNAAQALESAGKTLPGRIRVSSRATGDGFVEIRVADNGNGVPEALRDKIFDPFFTTKQVGKGTGQGLAICRNIVEVKHGGRLGLENVEGGGACFVIRLPQETAVADQLRVSS